MNNCILFVGLVAAVVALSEAHVGCPLTACPAIEHPARCRAETFMIYAGTACMQCDKCIPKGSPKAPNGCPIMPCLLIKYPEGCAAKKYFIWKNRLCEDCDVNICE